MGRLQAAGEGVNGWAAEREWAAGVRRAGRPHEKALTWGEMFASTASAAGSIDSSRSLDGCSRSWQQTTSRSATEPLQAPACPAGSGRVCGQGRLTVEPKPWQGRRRAGVRDGRRA